MTAGGCYIDADGEAENILKISGSEGGCWCGSWPLGLTAAVLTGLLALQVPASCQPACLEPLPETPACSCPACPCAAKVTIRNLRFQGVDSSDAGALAVDMVRRSACLAGACWRGLLLLPARPCRCRVRGLLGVRRCGATLCAAPHAGPVPDALPD